MARTAASGRVAATGRVAVSKRFLGRNMQFCIKTDGSSNSITPTTRITATGAFSVSCWFLARSSGSTSFLFGDSSTDIKIGFLSGFWFIRVAAGGIGNTTVQEPVVRKWHHMVVTRDSSDIVRLHVDGGAGQDVFSGVAKSGTYALGFITKTNVGQFFGGRVDEIRYWAKKLSDTEVSQLYYQNVTSSPSLEYLLNEGSGTTALDSAGTNNGTITGGTYNTGVFLSPRTAA